MDINSKSMNSQSNESNGWKPMRWTGSFQWIEGELDYVEVAVVCFLEAEAEDLGAMAAG